jgi:uncharacterized protein (DUF4415 family)
MSAQRTSKASGTDWDRLRGMPDEEIVADDVPYDPNDPDAVAAFWSGAQVSAPAVSKRASEGASDLAETDTDETVLVTLRLSPQVIRHFRATGREWQTKIDEALKEWIRGR